MQTVIVGAGLGGLSAACHLAGAGHDVVVLERGAVPGGRAGRLEHDGYRFDTGPTVLTMPDLLRSTFAAAGADLDDHLALEALDPMYRMSFADGSVLHVRRGVEAMTEEIRQVCGPGDAAAFGRFAAWLRDLYDVEMPHFVDRNFDSPLGLVAAPRPLLRLLRLGGLSKLAATVDAFFTDDRLRRAFSFQSMYAGLSPFEALAIYCVITYMDSIEGVSFPVGGMHAVPRALQAAAEKAGVEFRFDAEVARILRGPGGPGGPGGAGGAVTGVELADGERVQADAVVCNPDLPVAYRTLLPDVAAPRVTRRGRYSPSCAVWHVGVHGDLPAGAVHHNVHFGGEWRGAFDALLERGERMPDPSILVTVPTVSDPTLAPPGRHVLYVLEPVPNLDGRVDWTAERGPARQRLAGLAASYGYPVDAGDIAVEHFVDPLDWQRQGMERGTPFALAHTFFQTGPFRPANVNRRVPGLVFVGSGTLPGVGVPMVLVSGRLAAERVDSYAARRRRSA